MTSKKGDNPKEDVVREVTLITYFRSVPKQKEKESIKIRKFCVRHVRGMHAPYNMGAGGTTRNAP